MPGLITTDELTAEEIAELWETPADSPILKGQDAVYSALQANAPEVLIPVGIAHVCQSAVIQGTDTKEMSASFTILTRPKKTELNRGGRMVQIAPGPLGQGMKTENHQSNPVVLFNHGMEGFVFPIGLSQNKAGKYTVKCNQKAMTGTVYFSQKCPYAESIYGMIDDGLIRMSSAGFNVEQLVPIEVDTSKLPHGVQPMNKYGYDCTQSDLVEWSVVVAGADAGALRQCCETGKFKGHAIRPQLIPVLRQYAEKPQAWGIGFGDGTLRQSQGSTESPAITTSIAPDISRFVAAIESSVDQMKKLEQRISTLTENFASQQPQVKTPPTQPDAVPVQQQQQQSPPVVQQTQQIQQIDFAAIGQQLGSTVLAAVAAAMQPTRDAQQRLNDRINQLTGKLPD